MRVTALNYSDTVGGAARAAYRIHEAVRERGVDSLLRVNQKTLVDNTVIAPANNLAYLRAKINSGAAQILAKSLKTTPSTYHSLAFMPTSLAKELNQSSAELVHCHWINGEMISVSDMAKINKPLIWTLHDMWGFSGAEHYSDEIRWREGYTKLNRPSQESGLDLNRLTWQQKVKCWRKPMHMVTPSRWLAQCIKDSYLMHDWPVSVIANPIDTNTWQPIAQEEARRNLHISSTVPVLLFGAIGGGADPRKGFDLLFDALKLLRLRVPNLELIIFGQTAPSKPIDFGCLAHFWGPVKDDQTLRLLYSAADVMVVPSRQEAFGQTASEALACGCPVAAFDATGLKDVVEHRVSGYLAKPFDVRDLALGIEWLLQEQNRLESSSSLRSGVSANTPLRTAARQRAVDLFSDPVISQQYLKVYQQVIDAKR